MTTHRDGVMTMMNQNTESLRLMQDHNAEGIIGHEPGRGQGRVLLEEARTMAIDDDGVEVACEASSRAIGAGALLERGGGRGLIQ